MNKKITIFSDLAIHWNIVPTANEKSVFQEVWGAASTKKFLDLIAVYFNQKEAGVDWSFAGIPTLDQTAVTPTDTKFNQIFAGWKQYPEEKSKAWRIHELAYIGHSTEHVLEAKLIGDISSADLVIIQDWGMDIRHSEILDLAELLKGKWVICRGFSPLFEGKVWDELQKAVGTRFLQIIRADDLRKLNTSISKGLSWEQTIEDVVNEIYIKKNISLHPLRAAEYVIVSFGCTGTLFIHNYMDHKGKDPDIRSFFDPMSIEGTWEKNHPGYLPGDLELLAALMCKEIIFHEQKKEIDLDSAIRAYLLCRRALFISGGALPGQSLDLKIIITELEKVYGSKPCQEFLPVELPFALLQTRLVKNSEKNGFQKPWSLLGLTKWDLYSLARQIALYGPIKALQGWNIPIAKFNFLVTADRKEIEFLHHLRTLISEYLLQKNAQPLSIAVFGSPGSGKSFSIKQLAKTLDLPEQEIKDVTFNLSQFNQQDPADLYQAFHVVRDISLSGKIPLVFWDEFDSKELSWLRYFLAPMQDGEFQEGQLTHNIGKSIFVFAGGTCSCMEDFELKARYAVSEKGPDFLSRIKGFINIMGPNPTITCGNANACKETPHDEISLLNQARNADPEFIIRRAILVNNLLLLGYPHLFKDGELQIDDGVLNAFLLVPKYKHGTRSMETIFKTSQLSNRKKFYRSDLPPESQMNLHVDGHQFYELMSVHPRFLPGGKAFYHLVNEITLDEEVVEKMALGIFSAYSLVFSLSPDRSPTSITRKEFLARYSQMVGLPENMPHDEVSQNYHNARKIPEKLNAAGFQIVPDDSLAVPAKLTKTDIEKISRLEHIRWVRYYIDSGWSYHSQKQKGSKLHDALVAWDDTERLRAVEIYGKCYADKMGIGKGEILSERYCNLDRAISMAIPWILEIVGLKITKCK